MDTDAIYSAIASRIVSSKRGDHVEAEFYQDEIKRLLNEADAERQELLATNERLVDEVNELKSKLTDKASLLRGCYAADHKQKQRIEELTAELERLRKDVAVYREAAALMLSAAPAALTRMESKE